MTARARALDTPPEIAYTKTAGGLEPVFEGEVTLSSAYEPPSRNTYRFIEVVLPDWTGPGFDDLARTDPDRLVSLIANNTLAFHDLTFAAEAAGYIGTKASIHALLDLLNHHSPLVREGAVYGLSRYADQQWIQMRLEFLHTRDPVRGVRDAAFEALDEARRATDK